MSVKTKKHKVCIIGLGYVGMPLAVLISKKYEVVGFDQDELKIEKCKNGLTIRMKFQRKDIFIKHFIYE